MCQPYIVARDKISVRQCVCRNSGKNSRHHTAGPLFLSPAKLNSSMAPKRRRADQRAPPPAPPPPLRTELSQRRPVVVFAHGAGAPSSSDWMTQWALFRLSLCVLHALDRSVVSILLFGKMFLSCALPPLKKSGLGISIDINLCLLSEWWRSVVNWFF
jgi:hypothetical protein